MRIVSIKEVSEILRVKHKTIYQWAELGQIPCIKLNGTLRFDLDDIEAWVQSCKNKTVSGYNPFIRLEARKGGKK